MIRELSLDQLLGQARAGDRAAAGDIVTRFQPLVWSQARRLAHGPDMIDDLVQEGNLAVLTAIFDYRPGTAPFTWYVKRQVYYALMAWLRRSRRVADQEAVSLDQPLGDDLCLADCLSAGQDDPCSQVLAAMESEAFYYEWSRLPRRQRQAVAGRLTGLTFAAIAQQLGLTPSAVKGAYGRALVRLKKVLSPRVQESPVRQYIGEGGPKGV